MKIRKLIISIAVASLALQPLTALSIDEILEAANAVSYTMKNAELSHTNSLLLLDEAELEDEAVWSLSAEITPFTSADFGSESLNIKTLNASVTLPDDGDTTIAFSSPADIGYSDGALYITPTLSASHTFDFNYFDDDLISDLSNASSALSTERIYLEAKYNFNKSVISMLTNLLTIEKSIAELEHSIANAQRDLDNMITLRQADEESISYQRAALEISLSRQSLETYRDQYEKAKRQFNISTGLEWDGLESFTLPSFNLSVLDSGNSKVQEYALNSRVAALEVEQKEKEIDPRSLTLTGGAGVSYRNEASKVAYEDSPENQFTGKKRPWRNSGNASLGATLNMPTWSLGASFSLSGNTDFDLTPSLTITGSWKNDVTGKSDRLELERLRNEAISAENDYLDSLTSYNIEAMELQNRIMQYNFSLLSLEENESYLKAMLETERAYYEKGLVRADDVADAQSEYDLFQYEKLLTYLEGLSLYYDILIYSL